jgi:hypothetical protein
VYDEKLQLSLFTDVLQRLRVSFESHEYALPDSKSLFAAEVFSKVLRNLQLVKHPSFFEEAEWRVVALPLPSAGAHVKWRSRGPMPIPFVEIPLAREGEPLPIAEIVVGPMPNGNLAQALLRDAVFGLCGLRDVEIRLSSTPYRP